MAILLRGRERGSSSIDASVKVPYIHMPVLTLSLVQMSVERRDYVKRISHLTRDGRHGKISERWVTLPGSRIEIGILMFFRYSFEKPPTPGYRQSVTPFNASNSIMLRRGFRPSWSSINIACHPTPHINYARTRP